jgi:hypothetical protein
MHGLVAAPNCRVGVAGGGIRRAKSVRSLLFLPVADGFVGQLSIRQ